MRWDFLEIQRNIHRQAIRIRNEKQFEEAVRETIRAKGAQDIETAKAGQPLFCFFE